LRMTRFVVLCFSMECLFVIALSVFSDVYFILNLLEVSVYGNRNGTLNVKTHNRTTQ
jgi:hypothetical protein